MRRQAFDHQRAGFFVELYLGAQQVRFEADRQAFGAACEAAELVEGALVRWNLRGQAVILVADEVGERFRLVVVDKP